MQIELEKVSKSWGEVCAVDEVSFTAQAGELLVVLGPSGCGTILAVSPLLIAFLLFQRQFVQSFMRSGIK